MIRAQIDRIRILPARKRKKNTDPTWWNQIFIPISQYFVIYCVSCVLYYVLHANIMQLNRNFLEVNAENGKMDQIFEAKTARAGKWIESIDWVLYCVSKK